MDGMVRLSFTDPVAELSLVPTETVAGLKRSHSLIEHTDEHMGKLVDEAQQDIVGTIPQRVGQAAESRLLEKGLDSSRVRCLERHYHLMWQLEYRSFKIPWLAIILCPSSRQGGNKII